MSEGQKQENIPHPPTHRVGAGSIRAGSTAETLPGDATECLQAGICLDVPKSYGEIRGKKMLEGAR